MSGIPEWYAKFTDRYIKTFGLANNDENVGMLRGWYGVFMDDGYSEQDLRAAMREVAKNPPAYRTEHILFMQQHLKKARLEAANAARNERLINAKCSCLLCNDSGWVIVPHLWDVDEDGPEWRPPHRTFSVACACSIGYATIAGCEKRPPLSLDSYELRVPDWRQLMSTRERAKLNLSHQIEHARGLDREYGKLLATLGKIENSDID